uniref:Uncharacterized protein n=1 Tax=Syphacia muris TaxID=451379 RepID=A0A0N5AA65_9BILA
MKEDYADPDRMRLSLRQLMRLPSIRRESGIISILTATKLILTTTHTSKRKFEHQDRRRIRGTCHHRKTSKLASI